MIQIKDKSLCCGCSACVQTCPKQCISLIADKEGFLYPQVNQELCIECGLCENVCPELHQNEEKLPDYVYAAKHSDETIRKESSSGGIFSLLADAVIDAGGVVFGARFDADWNVIHDYTETHEGLKAFRGSKYVQSKIGDSYKQAELFLKAERKVLFSGTPCQIAGLKKFLRKDYENLLAVDFICHGVPSPLVWQKYLEETVAHQCNKNSVSSHSKSSLPEKDGLVNSEKMKIKAISFRNKNLGWKKYSFALTLSKAAATGKENTVSLSSIFHDNAYMQAFLDNLSLRPSCYRCPAKAGKSGSDITLGDFWGIEKIDPEVDDDKGCSLLAFNNVKAEKWLTEHGCLIKGYPFAQVQTSNICYMAPVTQPVNRAFFFSMLRRKGVYRALLQSKNNALYHRILRRLFRTLRNAKRN